jgi:hypothetical protein
MIYCAGNRGKRVRAELCVEGVLGVTQFHVIEGVGAKRRITHSFTADETFLKALMVEAKLGLDHLARERARGRNKQGEF